METKCENCKKDIRAEINTSFDTYKIGNITCPYCQSKQQRYISESDLLLYLFFIELLYSVVALIAGYAYEYFSIYFWLVELAFVSFVGAYFFQKFISKYIYYEAPFKKAFSNKTLEENASQVKKNIGIQFSIFIVLAFGSVIASGYRLELLFFLFSDVIITLLRYILSIRHEIYKHK